MHIIFFLLCLCLSLQLNAETNVLLFAGSTRKDSYNKKLIAEAAAIVQKMGAKATLIDLKDYPMPFYDGDLEAESGMPEMAKRLQKLMIASDVIIISSPEYNSSIPAVLKNAIDWTSRAETGGSSRIAYKDKKFMLLSVSPGSGGGKRALVHLRAIIEAIGGTVMQKQLSVPHASKAFDTKQEIPVKHELQELLSEAITK